MRGREGGGRGGPFDLILGSRCVPDLNFFWMVYYRQLVPHLCIKSEIISKSADAFARLGPATDRSSTHDHV